MSDSQNNISSNKTNAPGGYRGRFAPTPSGPLHLGSLVTALASFLQARSRGGAWLLRIDDLDRPRCAPGAADQILRQLEAHGLTWDEAPRFQSQHEPEYRAALARLEARPGRTYRCRCTRAELAAQSPVRVDGPVYGGACRDQAFASGALRIRVDHDTACLDDAWQGRLCRELATEVGDFTIQRADGQISYQLACAVDEAAQGITEVARGADLVGSTFRQMFLQRVLGLPQPAYRHLPVLVDAQGRKLSKQNHAAPVELREAPAQLRAALRFLRQPAPQTGDSVEEILAFAVQHWQPDRIPVQPAQPALLA